MPPVLVDPHAQNVDGMTVYSPITFGPTGHFLILPSQQACKAFHEIGCACFRWLVCANPPRKIDYSLHFGGTPRAQRYCWLPAIREFDSDVISLVHPSPLFFVSPSLVVPVAGSNTGLSIFCQTFATKWLCENHLDLRFSKRRLYAVRFYLPASLVRCSAST